MAVSDPLSLIRAANSVISANVDTLIIRTDGVSSLPVLSKEGKKKTNLICNDRSGEIVVLSTSDADLSQIAFFSASGVLFRDERISGKQYTISTDRFSPGVYIARVRSSEGVDVFKFRIK